jgi:hypothetical protein
MRRRRRGAGWQAEVFGTPLADILGTALGSVLLLFMAAVLLIRHSLSQEQAAHTVTQVKLTAEEEGRVHAEQERQVELGKRTALEQALEDERAARGQEQQALRAMTETNRLLAEGLAASQQAADEALARYRDLREAAQGAVQELDPRTARPVDVMLVIDGTRSMGPSLDAARRDLEALVGALRIVSPTARIGVVVFRDAREAPELRLEVHPLTDDEAALAGFLEGIAATSTSVDDDLPEWLQGGLDAAIASDWRPGALSLVVVVSDAAAQDEGAGRAMAAATRFRMQGGRVYVLSTEPSGYHSDPEVRAVYDSTVLPEHAAIAGAGGGAHILGTGSGALLREVLRAAFESRTRETLDDFRELLELPTP